ncbi:DMT family transporter [Parafrigoribacterium soli]|uniref:DMT family transporter n=1 Tax=Parafrigoribacterium soli TaxID=3144663 RepID=UPI0032EC563C
MPPDLLELTHAITLTPDKALGIPIALVGAVLLSLGAQFQHRGVGKVGAATATKDSTALSLGQLLLLLRRPSWVVGTLFLGLAILFQLTSLYLAPLIVVQPLGAVALVITAVVNARVSKMPLTWAAIRAIAFCVVGVALFVTIAAFTATSSPISESQLVIILVILGVVTVAFAIFFAYLRNRFKAIIYIVGAGVLYGFVATLAKVVIDRIKTLVLYGSDTGGFEWLTVICVVALLAATALGGYFVQSAYSSGPPDLVIAGLTVIDPIVAVCIGVVVLQEAAGASPWAILAFLVSGVVAVYGVFQLAKHHPQSRG